MPNETKYKNIEDLRNMLLNNIAKIETDRLGLNKAKELANHSGKVLNSCKIQMEYNTLKKIDATIDFLEVKK